MMTVMRTSDFDYHLPPELIAQEPVEPRDAARMMVLHRATRKIEHCIFRDLPQFVDPGDVLVVNNTRVIPARLLGKKEGTGGKVEILLLEEIAPSVWAVLLRARRRPRSGARIVIGNGELVGVVIETYPDGQARVRFECGGDFYTLLDKHGLPPLPPYIRRPVITPAQTAADRDHYQTIYASVPGAVAAPTAGLHFTEAVLQQLRQKGVDYVEITLHVGLGTFQPVKVENVERHVMHDERYEVSASAAERIQQARQNGGRVIAVGTTTVRTLETVADENGQIRPGSGRTGLFIRPGYKFRVVERLLTNFHLPRSTLLMLVCAFAGYDFVMQAYQEAVKERYRFYSYGDCMLIL